MMTSMLKMQTKPQEIVHFPWRVGTELLSVRVSEDPRAIQEFCSKEHD